MLPVRPNVAPRSVMPYCLAAGDGVEHAIVDVLQVPVVEERHHHPETVELARADEGIVVPAPRGRFFAASALALQTRSRHDVFAGDELLPAGEPWQSQDADLRPVVVFVDHVAGSPEQARGGRFRLGLFSELDLPPDAVFVFDFELRRRAAVRLLDESAGRCRARAPCPPGPPTRSSAAASPRSCQITAARPGCCAKAGSARHSARTVE